MPVHFDPFTTMAAHPQSFRRPQRGASLIEVLITMLIVALGLMGIAGMFLASTRYQQTSNFRAEAIHQASFIIEKMRVNNSTTTAANLAAAAAAPETAYLAPDAYADADDVANPNCGLDGEAACNAAQAAQRDLSEWRASLGASLPGGRGSIFPVANGGDTQANARLVVVMWREKAESETDTDANLGVDRIDDTCPAPRVAGIRCLNMWVTP
jgi:type IV pilus assembly protein PilV